MYKHPTLTFQRNTLPPRFARIRSFNASHPAELRADIKSMMIL